MSTRLKVTKDGLGKMLNSIASLTAKQVLVGIPSDTAEREDGEGVNNAALGYIHDHGSPANNIPPRPWLMAGIEEGMEGIEARLKKAAKAALDGNKAKADAELAAAGMLGEEAAKEKINSGDFAPLSESTLKARARRGRKGAAEELASRAAGNAPNADNARPLIDTGGMRNSVTHVIIEK